MAGVRVPRVRDRRRGRAQRRRTPLRAASASPGAPSAPSTTPSRSTRSRGARPEQHHDRERRLVQGGGRRRRSIACRACPTRRASRAPTRLATRGRSRPTGTPPCFASRSPVTRIRPRTASARRLRRPRAAQAANPDFTVEQFGDASAEKAAEQGDQQRLQAGVRDLAADHPRDPADRVRRPGRGRRSDHPGVDGGARHDRAGRPAQPHLPGVDSSINEVILLIGLAVGVDYSMFYLRREREERESGRSEEASLAAAAATSGRAVLVSGLTVMVAMAGHVPRPATPTFTSFATGTIIVVAVAVVGLVDGAARDARLARRPGREGRGPDHQGACRWNAGESGCLGAGRRSRCCAAR